MSRRNNKSNRREQAPKPPSAAKRRMPFPDEMKMGTEVHEPKKSRFEEEAATPMQCASCNKWWSSDDLNEDGLCDLCEEEQDKMNIVITAGELIEHGVWDNWCEISGTNIWAVNEGLMDSEEEIVLTIEQASQIGLLGPTKKERKE